MRYLVMECHPGYAVVLDGEGRFLKVANLHYTVGQTVTEVVMLAAAEPAARRRALTRSARGDTCSQPMAWCGCKSIRMCVWR